MRAEVGGSHVHDPFDGGFFPVKLSFPFLCGIFSLWDLYKSWGNSASLVGVVGNQPLSNEFGNLPLGRPGDWRLLFSSLWQLELPWGAPTWERPASYPSASAGTGCLLCAGLEGPSVRAGREFSLVPFGLTVPSSYCVLQECHRMGVALAVQLWMPWTRAQEEASWDNGTHCTRMFSVGGCAGNSDLSEAVLMSPHCSLRSPPLTWWVIHAESSKSFPRDKINKGPLTFPLYSCIRVWDPLCSRCSLKWTHSPR